MNAHKMIAKMYKVFAKICIKGDARCINYTFVMDLDTQHSYDQNFEKTPCWNSSKKQQVLTNPHVNIP